jgi:hypothetical protein
MSRDRKEWDWKKRVETPLRTGRLIYGVPNQAKDGRDGGLVDS